jgi:hypothetical protein
LEQSKEGAIFDSEPVKFQAWEGGQGGLSSERSKTSEKNFRFETAKGKICKESHLDLGIK